MNTQYRVLSRGVSAFAGDLEGHAAVLEGLLNSSEVEALTRDGWEIWRIEKPEAQSARGFLLILRRAV